MPVNAQLVFERAIALMDEGDEHTGRMDIPETRGYKHRALPLINLLGQECADILWTGEEWEDAEDFETPLRLREEAARTALPYGLAAQLFLDEAPAAAAFFQRRYEELLARLVRGAKAETEEIPLPYGTLEAKAEGGWPRWR